jgi:hypothetical protein
MSYNIPRNLLLYPYKIIKYKYISIIFFLCALGFQIFKKIDKIKKITNYKYFVIRYVKIFKKSLNFTAKF